MSYTIAEKILASHSGLKKIAPGEFIECAIDMIMVHEQLGGRIYVEYEKLGIDHRKDSFSNIESIFSSLFSSSTPHNSWKRIRKRKSILY